MDKRGTEMLHKKAPNSRAIRANIYRRSIVPKIECGSTRNFTITALGVNRGQKILNDISPKIKTDIGTIKYIYKDKHP